MTQGRFTEEYPESDYKPTLNSTHAQSKFWPPYLPVDDTRLFIFERSKNAQLVVYTANFLDKEKRQLDPKWPLDINWQSFGWTDAPTSNGTGTIERRMAWGYKYKLLKDLNNCPSTGKALDGIKYKVNLSAMSSRDAYFFLSEKGIPTLETTIGGKMARMQKIFVKTTSSHKFIPSVEYVEIYGVACETEEDAYEKYIP